MRPVPALHRVLLRMYPRAFRERCGAEISAFWQQQIAEPRYRGAWGRLRLWVHLFRDSVAGAVRQRLGGDAPPPITEPPQEPWRARWASEFRRAVRALGRAPGFAAVAAVTLSLGIGATTAVFAVVEHVLIRPLPYHAPERLVMVSRTGGAVESVSWPDYADWRESARGFDGMAAWMETSADFSEADGAATREGLRATRDLFEVLGVSPMLGRTFTAEEDRSGGPEAVILSWGLWQDQFGGDPGAVGGTVRMDGEAVAVVGVMPRGFAYPDRTTDFWTPLREDEAMVEAGLPAGGRRLGFLDIVARLSPGVSVGAASADLRALVARIDDAHLPADRPRVAVGIETLLTRMVGDVRGTLLVLLGAAGLVLIVACANVAGLAVSRAAVRQHELAVRAALGAGRRRLLGQLLAEGAVLTLIGGAAGLAIGWAALRGILALAPPGVPRIDTLGLDARAFGAWAGITLLSGLLFAVIPALRGSRTGSLSGIARGTRGASLGRGELRPQRALVVFQVALSVVLLAGASLLARSYASLRAVDPGYTTGGILTASIAPPERRYAEPARTEAFWSELLDRVRALPGVEAATSTYSAPLTGQGFRTTVVPERNEDAEPVWVGSVAVRDHYFETTGVRLLSGRDFTPADVHGAPNVAIVSESMARQLWPDTDPIGQRFRLRGGISGALYSYDREYFADWFTVIGVASDVRRERLDLDPIPEYYRPHAQLPWPLHTIIVRAARDPEQLAGTVREIVRDIDPDVPVQSVRTVRAQIRDALAAPRFRMLLLVSFGAITCLLAMVGLHAVTALAVARRTREMGIRLALGATRRTLLTHVLGGGLALVLVGTVVGLAAAAGATRALSALLFGVSPGDPATYAGVAAVTAVVALVACLLPARRASRVDPIRSIQAD